MGRTPFLLLQYWLKEHEIYAFFTIFKITNSMYIATRRARLEAREAGFLVYYKYVETEKDYFQ